MIESCGGCCLVLILVPLLICIVVGGVALYVYNNAPDQPVAASFTPSPVDAQAFQAVLDGAEATARSQGWFWMSFTEQQLSSWMALEGADFADQQGTVFPFSNMQVGLDDNAITFYGELDPGVMAVPIEVVIEPKVSATGDFEFDITSVDVGGVQAPDFLTTVVSSQFEDILVKPLEQLPGDLIFYQETLKVDNGIFEVQGRVN
jgi:uncharacterized protein YpmS